MFSVDLMREVLNYWNGGVGVAPTMTLVKMDHSAEL